MMEPGSDRATESRRRALAARLRQSSAKSAFRWLLFAVAILASAVIGAWFPQISAPVRSFFSSKTQIAQPEDQQSPEGLIKLTDDQIAAARIEIGQAGPGLVTKRLVVPAAIKPDPDRVGRVAAKVAGTVSELRKKLGDQVAVDEVIAIIDSREVADAKSEFLAAAVQYDLQNQLFLREKGLFEKKITAEQLFLKAKTSFAEAKLRLDLARQKLASLDLSESEIANLSLQPVSSLRRKEIRAPIAGRVIDRLVSLGQPVGGEGQAKELYVLSDLSVVDADLAVPVNDLAAVREGQPVHVTAAAGREFEGKVVIVHAVITKDTRSGRVIARFANPDFALRPGSFFNARIAIAEKRVNVRVPRSAVQIIGGEPSVFVRTEDGFVKRKIETGAADKKFFEIRSGVAPGEQVATTNTFVLKADLGKKDFDPGL